MKISLKDSTMLRPAQQTPNPHLWISNVDLVVSRYHYAKVFFYRFNGSSDFFHKGSLLKDSLSKILVLFYPLAGRFGYDQNGRLEIVCNSEGVVFVEAESNATLNDLGDFAPSPELQKLVPTVDYSCDISSYPLVLLQVTKFRCGGVCIGAAFQHTLMDGNSAYYFMKCWGYATRGLSITVIPFLDRALLKASLPPTPSFHHVEYDPTPKMNPANPQFQATNPKPSTSSVFKITLNQLKTLKAKAEIDYGMFNIIAAHAWRCVCRARGLLDDQTTKLYVPVDGRNKLNNPPLPPGYLGNVVFMAATTAISGDLQSEPFRSTVERISKMLKQMNNKYLRSALDYIESVPDTETHVRGAHTFQSPNLLINSFSRFPLYDADFGWGRPIHTGFANIPCPGIIYISPSRVDDGSLLLAVCLETAHVKPFEKFLYDFSLPLEKLNARY